MRHEEGMLVSAALLKISSYGIWGWAIGITVFCACLGVYYWLPHQDYWYCWNDGMPSPHHLGYEVSGDRLCKDWELDAAGKPVPPGVWTNPVVWAFFIALAMVVVFINTHKWLEERSENDWRWKVVYGVLAAPLVVAGFALFGGGGSQW
jgi:hypothetical protein